MGVRTYIGIDTESDSGNFAFGGSQFVDDFQFGYRFYIETEDIIIQSQIDFPIGFADTRIYDFISWEACFDSCTDFTATHTVCSQTVFTNNSQNLVVGIGFHCVMHAEVVVFACFFIDARQRFAQYIDVVIVKGSFQLSELVDGECSFHIVFCY